MSYKQFREKEEFHVGIIMDGNGRWATNQNKPRFLGHQAGAERVREIVESAVKMDIDILTVYAFSSDNWLRPKKEVDFLMLLFERYLKSEIQRCLKNNIKMSIIGRRDRLKSSLIKLIEKAERKTRKGEKLHLRIAIDYSSRYSIMIELKKYRGQLENFYMPDVDFIIRTGGEQRLSDFMLWECAYAELYFTKTLWPDFTGQSFRNALDDYYNRDRRFGRIPNAIAV